MKTRRSTTHGLKTKATILSIALLISAASLEAQTSWIDGVGDWFNFFNWSNGVPNSGSAISFDAQINNGGIAQIFSPGASVRRITLGNLNGQGGGLLVDLGSLNVTENLRLGENGGMGNMTIRNDADVSASQTILGVFSGSGLMTVSGNGSTLTSSTLILAELASGTMVVRDGADVSGSLVSLANASTSALGRLTVTGAGSTLTADNTLWIGRAGVGELTVDTGGAVTAPTIDLGSNTFGNGFVTVTGAGSTITSTNTFLVGNNGVGTLIISAGGRANSIAMGVGFMSNSFGTVTVTGAGSRLVDTFNSIYIGYDGAGTLNIADGGIVTVNSGFGTVLVGGTANGGASTLRIGQGAAPGTLQAGGVSLFRANSQLELNHTGIIAFTPVISGPGSVIQIANGTTTLTANNTFTGPVTVRAGLLELSGGGRINNATDSNVADGAGQVASVRINGAGSKWINTASTFIGAVGTGTVTVENGGEFRSDVQLLVNRFADGNGALTVTGAGSKATTNGFLRIADEGVGLLDIENGGVVMSGESYLATNTAAANGMAIVNGTGSLWSMPGHLTVGYTGIGTLRIENAGAVSSGFGEIGYLASSNSSATITGANSLWTITNFLTVGDRGSGTLQIESGGKVRHTSSGGYVGTVAGSMGTANVVGAGSAWEPVFLVVGASGTGMLNVTNGGRISTGATYLGSAASGNGTALLSGTGSTWTSTSPVEIGSVGIGNLTIADGAAFTAGGGAGAVTVAVNSGSVGILNIGNGAAPGTLSAGSVVFGQSTGQLVFNHTGNLTFSVPVSGPGSMTKLATGTTTLSANSTFTGPVIVRGGLLELSGGGRINNATDSNIADAVGQAASVRINGANSKWINTASTFIGSNGMGSVTVEAGGELRSDVQLLVNRFATGSGALTVTGIGSKAMTNGEFRIADEGIGSVRVEAGGTITSALVELARQSTGNATAVVSGAGSLWYAGNYMAVGRRGTGSLRIESGGKVISGTGFVGTDLAGAMGTVVIDGSGSAWESNSMIVGESGMASVTVSGGGRITTGATTFGLNSTGNALGILTGAGSTWTSNGAVTVGSVGIGDLRIADGATFTAGGGAGALNIAVQPGSTGILRIGTGAAPGTLNAGSVVFGQGTTALLSFNHTGDLTFALPISGTGFVQKLAAGTTTLTANNSYTIATRIFEGILRTNNPNGQGFGTGPISVETGFANLHFFGSALAGSNSIMNNHSVMFLDSASAGTATIENQGGTPLIYPGQTVFAGSTTAASASLINRRGVNGWGSGTTLFQDNATAATSNIMNEASIAENGIGGILTFTGSARAGTAQITNAGASIADFVNGAAITQFRGLSTAQNATIINQGSTKQFAQGGETDFYDSASAGASNITNRRGAGAGAFGFQGRASFSNNSIASTATIVNEGGNGGGDGGLLDFVDSASAGMATVTNRGSSAGDTGGLARFFSSSTASQATLTMEGALSASGRGGRIWFLDTSTAGGALLRAKGGAGASFPGGTIQFYNASTSGTATITNETGAGASVPGGSTTFLQTATAGSATVTNEGAQNASGAAFTHFNNTSNAGSAIFFNKSTLAGGGFGGRTRFFDNAGAGTATFDNEGAKAPRVDFSEPLEAGETNFRNLSSAQGATFINRGKTHAAGVSGGITQFLNATRAGTATITNEGSQFASGSAPAGGWTRFREGSSAEQATITNRGAPSAGGAGGETYFDGSLAALTPTADRATLTNEGASIADAPGGRTIFSSTAAAGSATLIALGGSNGGLGGRIYFESQASGGNARASVQGNGSLTIESLSTAGSTLGSIAGSGNFLLGNKTLTVGSLNTSTTVSGSISGSGGTLTKVGTGTLTISAVQSYTTLNADGGTTILESALGTGSSIANVNASAIFAADQKLAALNIGPAGRVMLSETLPAVKTEPLFDPEAAPDFSAPRAFDSPNDVTLVNTAPEPGAILLAVAGGATLLFRRRRQHLGEIPGWRRGAAQPRSFTSKSPASTESPTVTSTSAITPSAGA